MRVVDISNIQIVKRIRNEISKVDELAADIKTNGLLNPVSVMPLDDGRYQLLAGLRRLKACISLGLNEIEVNVIPVADAEHALRIEFSENEQRENFTFSEKMDYARLIEEIEKAKAKDRQRGGQGGVLLGNLGSQAKTGRARDEIGKKLGISGGHYERAKFVAANAPAEVIRQLDEGKVSIKKAYTDLKNEQKGNVATSACVSSVEQESSYDAKIRRLKPNKLTLNPYYAELKAKFETARHEANAFMNRMREMEENHKNQMYHLEGINSMLERRIETLESALSEAKEKIIKLGGESI